MKNGKTGTGLKLIAFILILAGICLIVYQNTDVFDFVFPKNSAPQSHYDEPSVPSTSNDDESYPEAKTSNSSSVPAEVAQNAYKNSTLSYIIYDISSNKDCSSLWIQPRTESDNVRNETSTMMKYDEDFFANFLKFSDFSFNADSTGVYLSFDVENTSGKDFTGVYFFSDFIDKTGSVLYEATGGFSSLKAEETARVTIKYMPSSDEKTLPASFALTGVSMYRTENGSEISSSWNFD